MFVFCFFGRSSVWDINVDMSASCALCSVISISIFRSPGPMVPRRYMIIRAIEIISVSVFIWIPDIIIEMRSSSCVDVFTFLYFRSSYVAMRRGGSNIGVIVDALYYLVSLSINSVIGPRMVGYVNRDRN